MLCNLPSGPRDGKLHGSELVLGLVAQQFQFGRTQIEERRGWRRVQADEEFRADTIDCQEGPSGKEARGRRHRQAGKACAGDRHSTAEREEGNPHESLEALFPAPSTANLLRELPRVTQSTRVRL